MSDPGKLSQDELTRRVDALMAAASLLQDQGRHAEADTLIAEAQNIEDAQWDTAP